MSRRGEIVAGAALLVVVLAAAYSLSIGLRATRGASITGDEPFYLMTTQSLLADGNLDLREQYAFQTYRDFFDHEQPLWTQSAFHAEGPILSPHEPGLSLYLIPGFALAGLRGAQVQMLVTTALAFALVFVLVALEVGRPALSWLATLGVALSATPFVYATEIYPEVPAALCLVLLLWIARRRAMPLWHVVAAVALCSALAWLGTKYVPLAGIAALAIAWRTDARGRLALVGLGALSGVVYVAWHLATYGALTAYSVSWAYEGAGTIEVVREHIAIPERAYRLVGLFVDARFGVGRWAPLLLLVVPALPLLLRRGLGGVVVALVVTQLLIATFVAITMMGWWFPGRTLMTVLPFAAWPLAELLARAPRWARFAVGLLGAWSLAVTASLVVGVRTGPVRIALDPFELQSPWFRVVAPLFPDYRVWDAATISLHLLWTGLLYGGMAYCLLRGRERGWWPAVTARATLPARLRRIVARPGSSNVTGTWEVRDA